MARFSVITSYKEDETQEGIIAFPQNRTLYVDQFTDEVPAADAEHEGFMPRSMNDVFEYYRPTKYNIKLKTEEGEVVYEDFYFHSLKDFEDDHLIKQSELLSIQKANGQAEDCLRNNLFYIHEQVKELEVTYRTLNAFFDNAGQDKTDCLTLINVNKSKLGSYDSEDSKAIRGELQKNYQCRSLVHCYSLFVLPGYLGNAETVKMWARTAYENKVIMVTDFKDCTDFEALQKDLDRAKLQGQDGELSHVIMTCNYLLGRKKSEHAQEEDDLFFPGSGALAGRMTDTESNPIYQGVIGRKYGILSNVKDVRFDLSKVQIATLMDQGVVPIVKIDDRIMGFSNCSLYNGAIFELKEYPIVRVLDWIEKAIQNYLNIQSLRIWDSKMKEECCKAIHNFLFDCKNSQIQPVEGFIVKKLELDSINKEIRLEIEFAPNYSKRLLMEMVGHVNDSGEINWQ